MNLPVQELSARSPLGTIRAVAWAGTAVMVAAIATGLVTAEDGAVAELLANVWARVTIVDLYIALGVVATWIGWRERSLVRTVPWAIAIVLTGSVAVCAYIAVAAHRSRTMPELLVGPQDITL